jgi:HSP20 family molecular chaperone IbpA
MANRDDFDRLESIQELIDDLWQVPRFARRQSFRPNVDSYRLDDPPQIVVIVELAGVDPADLRLEVGERTLLIAGERRRPVVDGSASYHQVEIEWGPFERRLQLAEDVRPDAAEADYERGVLTIRLPVAEKQKPPEPVRTVIAVRVTR